MNDKRPVSPVNGQPVPDGSEYQFEQGDKQREIARKAGRKSGEIRRARKTLREELLALLSEQITDKNSGKKVAAQEAMSTALIRQAVQGNTKAYEIIRDTIGEKPMETVSITAVDFSALDTAFDRMAGDEK